MNCTFSSTNKQPPFVLPVLPYTIQQQADDHQLFSGNKNRNLTASTTWGSKAIVVNSPYVRRVSFLRRSCIACFLHPLSKCYRRYYRNNFNSLLLQFGNMFTRIPCPSCNNFTSSSKIAELPPLQT